MRSGLASAIYIDQKTCEKFTADFGLRVNVPPIPRGAPIFTQADAEEIAAGLQSRLQGYRLLKLPEILKSDFDISNMEVQSSTVARSLGRCIVGAPELQDGIRSMLEGSEECLQNDRWTDIECVTLEASLARSHESGVLKVTVGQIAEDTSAILDGRGESAEIKPRRAGAILRQLGFSTR